VEGGLCGCELSDSLLPCREVKRTLILCICCIGAKGGLCGCESSDSLLPCREEDSSCAEQLRFSMLRIVVKGFIVALSQREQFALQCNCGFHSYIVVKKYCCERGLEIGQFCWI
jgi:hypothetical protein